MPGLFQRIGQQIGGAFAHPWQAFQQNMARQNPNSWATRIGYNLGLVPNPLQSLQGNPNVVTPLGQPQGPLSQDVLGGLSGNLHNQFNLMTGGLNLGPNANLAAFTTPTGNIDPRNPDVARSILGQFGLPQGFDPNNILTNGQLDLTKLSPAVLARISAPDRTRLMNANVLGATLLNNVLNQPAAPAARTYPTRTRGAKR